MPSPTVMNSFPLTNEVFFIIYYKHIISVTCGTVLCFLIQCNIVLFLWIHLKFSDSGRLLSFFHYLHYHWPSQFEACNFILHLARILFWKWQVSTMSFFLWLTFFIHKTKARIYIYIIYRNTSKVYITMETELSL